MHTLSQALRSATWLPLATASMFLSACGGDSGGPGSKPNDASMTSGGSADGGGTDEDDAGGNNGEDSGSSDGSNGSNSGTSNAPNSSGGEDDGGVDPPVPDSRCDPVTGEALPARKVVSTAEEDEDPDFITVTVRADELFDQFLTTCGSAGCHSGSDDPLLESPQIFKLTRGSFDQRPTLGDDALERILSPDAVKVMPPGSVSDGSKRPENDPVRLLGEQLKDWQEAGFPDSFEREIPKPHDPTSDELPEDPYLLSSELGASLTNIGSCLPDADIEKNVEAMRSMDELFERAQETLDLPRTLVETDLVSLDNEVLARRGVYSYAPTYTLFSDHAKKMRYVRVPVGEKITYNEETHDFDIPENTRFYKTFLKPVHDKDGGLGYRKMETRLIVSRPDEQLPDGSFRPRALRATYAWDENEQMARLVTDPFRSGKVFADRLCPYITDERVTRDPEANPIIDNVSQNCTYMTQEQREDPSSGSIRHYAIPSSERCDQCHMGSSSRAYILGFNPWQVDRRPADEGGVYDYDLEQGEGPSDDELAQLQRLIDYGVVEGIVPGEAKLEESQGEREPRNEHELKAQGYRMGNCAFCHNPNGFPSVQNPILEPFELFPEAEGDGGAFQFPLEKVSPRAEASTGESYPYIVPGFGVFEKQKAKVAPWNAPTLGIPFNDGTTVEDLYDSIEYENDSAGLALLAPWRSLIWRNVYTPFTYTDTDSGVVADAMFIHMPRNVPGFDCRAQKIMASWMLSIPSVAKSSSADQPFLEVLPGEDGYEDAKAAAAERVEIYLRGLAGSHCPDDDDIVDPRVVTAPTYRTTSGQLKKSLSAPEDTRMNNSPRLVEDWLSLVSVPPFADTVPDHAHWVPVDTSDPLDTWVPRRPNWKEVLVTRELVPEDEAQVAVIDQLQDLHLSEAYEALALTPQPLGVWDESCNDMDPSAQTFEAWARSPTVGHTKEVGLTTSTRWLTRGSASLENDARLHTQTRGQAVFTAICQNCHGANADSLSPLATTILELQGGQTRVANFVDGLFGPREAPGSFAAETFRVGAGATAEDWQARYMVFMTMGGTEAEIPGSVTSIVLSSPFYGEVVRSSTSGGSGSAANMLDAAVNNCKLVLDRRWSVEEHGLEASDRFKDGTGQYELWEALCQFENEPVVRVLTQGDSGSGSIVGGNSSGQYRSKDARGNWVYPIDHPVGNQFGIVERGIQPANTVPWCVRPRNATHLENITAIFNEWGIAENMRPFCPEALFATAYGQEIHKVPDSDGTDGFNAEFRARWIRQGAFTTGIAAYYYLDRWLKGLIEPAPAFDNCGN